MSILDKVKKGDENAFAELIDKYKLPIYKTAKAMLMGTRFNCMKIEEKLVKNVKKVLTNKK